MQKMWLEFYWDMDIYIKAKMSLIVFQKMCKLCTGKQEK